MALSPLLLALLLTPAQNLATLAAPRPLSYADLPAGFADTVVARGLNGATAMAIAPDGRVFVCEQTGAVRVVKDDRLLETPFVQLAVDSAWERGLLGIALDPAFPGQPYVYLLYVADKPYPHHRLSRFTARGDVAVPGSEMVLLEGDDQRKLGGAVPAGHQGGPIQFGPDGKLYLCIGEQTAGEPAQRLDTFQGKLLRLNRDGSIPEDNPFYRSAKGKYRAIWAVGLRNPYGLAFQRSTGRMFFNDVGGSRYEEINEGRSGANYGWPLAEGPSVGKGLTGPVHAYDRSVGRSITAGVFYEPRISSFPDRHQGKYFFCDYIDNWIRVLDPTLPGKVERFAGGLRGPVDLRVTTDGSLLVLQRNVWVKDDKYRGGTGSLHRITWATMASGLPRIVKQPADAVVAPGQKVTLSVEAEGTGPLAYQWDRDGVAVKDATSPALEVPPGAQGRYRCLVTGAKGAARSATVRVRTLSLATALNVKEALPGVECRSYEIGDFFDLDAMPHVRRQVVSRLDPTPRTRDERFALVHTGLLRVPEDGVYTFHVTGKHATLWLAHRRVDGPVGLRKGYHALRLVHVHDSGKPSLSVTWSGPGFAASELPTTALWHAGAAPLARPLPWTLHVPPTPEALPERLSRTGLFRSLKELTPATGVVPYDVNSPLWSDGASKRRWIALPHADAITFRPRGEWGFPAATVFVKHFELGTRRLETRLLVTDGEGSGYGVTYRWRPDGSDADLLKDGLSEKVGERTWQYPGRGDCLVCHTTTAGFVLGVTTRQLHRAGKDENQLHAWARRGLLDRVPGDLSTLSQLPSMSDTKVSLERRVRSYLDANCAFCHRPGGAPGQFDLRFDSAMPRQQLLKAPLAAADLGLPDARLIVPGEPGRSMLYLRMQRRQDVYNMPPLASNHPDAEALAALEAWIKGMK